MNRRHLVSLHDLGAGELAEILGRARRHAEDNEPVRTQPVRTLSGCVVGLNFRWVSTRTRTAFSVGAMRLGAQVISYGPQDLQENAGESPEDTARVLSKMLDALIVRSSGSLAKLRVMTRQSSMAIVNALTDDEHPTQALADLSVLSLRFGLLDGLQVMYLGEGNNTAAALALAVAHIPRARLHLRTPAGYGLPQESLAFAKSAAASSGAHIEEMHDAELLPDEVNVVYTTRWEAMGVPKEKPNWRTEFWPFRVTDALMQEYPHAVFMHDLPAHRGEEVESSVIDGPQSIVFSQAQHKLFSAMAVLEWCIDPDSFASRSETLPWS